MLSISTYLPREGTDTHLESLLSQQTTSLYIATYPPREGPETDQLLVQGSLVFQLLYSSLSTSGGAGNSVYQK